MSERHPRPYDSVLDLIGWTPMVRLNSVTDGSSTPVYVKCEFFGPGGSIKDRIGLAMIEAAEADGSLHPGGTVVEATGGNTGLALAMAASLKGYGCICTMTSGLLVPGVGSVPGSQVPIAELSVI